MFCTDFFTGWYAASGKVVEEEHGKLTVHQLPSGDKPYLPCLIVNCGSAGVLMLVSCYGYISMLSSFPLALLTGFNCYIGKIMPTCIE